MPEQASHLLHQSISDYKEATENSIIVHEGTFIPNFTNFGPDFQRLIIFGESFSELILEAL